MCAIASEPTLRRVPGPGGVALAVWDYGGGGTLLLLAHCNGGCGRLWEPLVPKLLERFRVVAPDLRGHGLSEAPALPGDYAWALQGADLLAVRDALGPAGPVFGVGHSSGASYLLEAEAQRPGTFAGLLLLDPVVGVQFLQETGPRLAQRARRRREAFGSRPAARAHFAGKPPMDAWDPRVLDAFVAHGLRDHEGGGVVLSCPRSVEAQVYEAGAHAETEAALPRIACPCLVVGGGGGPVAEAARAAAARLPHGAYRALAGTSHFIPQELPERSADLILASLGQGGRAVSA